jgi:hypothetical protein
MLRRLIVAIAAAVAVSGYVAGRALAADDCSTANAQICINVGETARIKVTNSFLQTFCVDTSGRPDDELVEPNVTGEPTTGGAGATFRPDVFRAYSQFSTLSIHTTVDTKPGNYTVDIGARGEHCGRYNGNRVLLLVRPKILGPDRLWSFKGAHPAGYATEIVLSAQPANQPPYTWYIIGSRQWLRLPNGQSSIRTNVNHVKLTAIAPNPGVSTPSVFLSVGGAVSLLHEVNVSIPFELVPLGHRFYADANRGYRAVWQYRAVDQFGDTLPSKLPLEIEWTSPQVDLFPRTNWTRSPSGARATVDPTRILFAIVPRTAAGLPVDVGVPRPEEPHRGTTKVDCWKAAIYLGGDESHQGVKVDSQFWVRYRDHATTEAPKCP